ncbi:hypothetical protein HDU98_010410 [Podochytrium sp. JEL0797]|nr:hypothetical protein HDU98_010410 [Podochytrium sp. JEL0797]
MSKLSKTHFRAMTLKSTKPVISPNSKRKADTDKLKAKIKKLEDKNARELLSRQKKILAAAKKKEVIERKAARAVVAARAAAEKAERDASKVVWNEADSLALVSLVQEAKLMHDDTSRTSVGFVALNAFKSDYISKPQNRERFNLQQFTADQIENHLKNQTAAFKVVFDKCEKTGNGGLHDQLALKGLSMSLYDALKDLFKDNDAVTGPLRNESGQAYVTHADKRVASAILEEDDDSASDGSGVGDLGVGGDSELDGGNSDTDSLYSEHEQQNRKTLRLQQESRSILVASTAHVADNFDSDDDIPLRQPLGRPVVPRVASTMVEFDDDDDDIPLLPPSLGLARSLAASIPDRGGPSTAVSPTVPTPASQAASAAVPRAPSVSASRVPSTATSRVLSTATPQIPSTAIPRVPAMAAPRASGKATATPRPSSLSKKPPAGENKSTDKRRKNGSMSQQDTFIDQRNEFMHRSQATSDRTVSAMEGLIARPGIFEQFAQAALPLLPTVLDYFFNRNTPPSGGNSYGSNQHGGYGSNQHGSYGGNQQGGYGGSQHGGYGGNQHGGYSGGSSRNEPYGGQEQRGFGGGELGGIFVLGGGQNFAVAADSHGGGEGLGADTRSLSFMDQMNNPFIHAYEKEEE